MTDPRRRRPTYSALLLLLLLALGLTAAPRAAHADSASASPVNLHFTGVIVHGPDAGVQLDGFLSLTPGTGTSVTGTFSTFAGELMSRLSSYTPIPVAGTLNSKTIALSFDLSGMSTGSSSGAGSPMLSSMAMPHFAHSSAHPTLHGTGQLLSNGSFAGSFSGPDSADSGSWAASLAESHGFDFSAASKSGKKLSMSGQAAVVFNADGTVDGLYISDNFKSILPVHGLVGNNWMTVILPTATGQFLYGSGQAGNIDVYQYYSGKFYGPNASTSGTWSAAFTS